MTSSSTDPAAEAIAYTDAIAELNEILAALEDDDIDIDTLGDRVSRAAELITVCRDRITTARLRVTEIVADLDAPAAAAIEDTPLDAFANERDDE